MKNLNERIKDTLINLAVEDELPMDMTELDPAVFDNISPRIYGVDLLQVPGEFKVQCSDEDWISAAEEQGYVWTLPGFQKTYNTEILGRNVIIRII